MKVLIVDDEILARERLQRLLARLSVEVEVYQADSGEEAMRQIDMQVPDLVLLDIRMPGMDGIEVAQRLEQLPQPPAVIFCTAYDQYALEALRHQAVAYLLKPVREADLKKAVEGAGRVNRVQLASLRNGADSPGVTGPRTTLTSRTHKGVQSIELAQVRCFIADQKYVSAYTPEKEWVVQDTLKELEEEFASQFVRVHRNALVALAHIEALHKNDDQGWQVVLRGVELQPVVGRRHLTSLRGRMEQR